MAQHITHYRIKALCESLQVSRSDFYRWRSRKQVVCAVDEAGQILTIDPFLFAGIAISTAKYQLYATKRNPT